MKTLAALAMCVSVICSAHAETRIEIRPKVPTFPVNNGAVDVENSLTKLNPFYKQQAGTYYETEYLGAAAANLFERLDLEWEKRVGALDILRGFIYDWLDFYVRDNGQIKAKHQAAATESMNAKFRTLLTTDQYKLYETWRQDRGGGNALAFLIHYDGEAVLRREGKAAVK